MRTETNALLGDLAEAYREMERNLAPTYVRYWRHLQTWEAANGPVGRVGKVPRYWDRASEEQKARIAKRVLLSAPFIYYKPGMPAQLTEVGKRMERVAAEADVEQQKVE